MSVDTVGNSPKKMLPPSEVANSNNVSAADKKVKSHYDAWGG